MKKLIYIALILLGVGILSSCSKEGGGSGSLVGTWDVVKTETETIQGNRTQCGNNYDKFVFTDSALSIYVDNEPTTLAYVYDKENKTINWGMRSFIVEKHTSNELVLIDDTSIYRKWDYWFVVTLKKK